jgi:hypothetical protein
MTAKDDYLEVDKANRREAARVMKIVLKARDYSSARKGKEARDEMEKALDILARLEKRSKAAYKKYKRAKDTEQVDEDVLELAKEQVGLLRKMRRYARDMLDAVAGAEDLSKYTEDELAEIESTEGRLMQLFKLMFNN